MVKALETPLEGIIIPAALLIAGTAMVQPYLVPYGILITIILVGFKFYRGRRQTDVAADTLTLTVPGIRRVLDPTHYQEFELMDKTPVSPNTAIYRFKLPKPNDTLGLPVGQHITVACNIGGKEISRSYTPISSDDDRGYFDLLVKSYPTGNVSKCIGNLIIGQTIRVRGPKGQMVYRPNMAAKIGMIAGGTGITPMLQIVRAILKNPNDRTQISLVFANVNEIDILLRDDLEELMAKYPQFKCFHCLNNPPPVWTGCTGFVTADIIRQYLPEPTKDVKVLICGPPPMIKAMKVACQTIGYEPARPVSKVDDQLLEYAC